jgi:hypothetical protein
MTFADFEARIRDDLDRMLGGDGFSSAHDILANRCKSILSRCRLFRTRTGPSLFTRGAATSAKATTTVLTFKLYAAEAKNTDLGADFGRFTRLKPGTLYEDTDYYTHQGLPAILVRIPRRPGYPADQ